MGMPVVATPPLSRWEREDALERSWALAVRVAVAASALMAVLGVALVRFGGVPAPLVVALAGTVALAVGTRLPAARPAWARRLADQVGAPVAAVPAGRGR